MIPATYPSDSTGAMVVQMIYSTTGLTRWVDYIPVKFVAVGAAGDTYANAGAKSAVESLTGTSWSTFISCYEDPTATKPWSTDIGGYIPISPNTGFFSFAAPLVNSLVALKGTGTPTFTRADATACATHTDFEGVVRVVPANCARFQGARLVRNDVSGKSEDCTTGANTTANVTVATTSLTFTSANAGYWYRSNGQVKAIGSVMVFRALISSTVSRTVMIRASNNSSATNESKVNLSIDIIPKIVSLTLVVSTAPGALLFGIDNRASQGATDIGTTGTITFTNIQIEDVTGQTNQNPSEYVSVGVLAAPYQGAGVDGIQFFSTLNPNQVSGNVVTSGTGAAIKSGTAGVSATAPVDASGPLGYLSEGSRVNLLTYSDQFNNAAGWQATLVTVTADASISPDGKVSADLLTNSGASAYMRSFTGTASVAAQSMTLSCYIKAGTAPLFQLLVSDLGANYGGCSFNLSTLATTLINAGTCTAVSPVIVPVGNGWYRASITFSYSGILTYYSYVVCASSTGVLATTSGQTGTAWGAQLEQAAFASTYIPTAATAATRAADQLTYPSAGNVSGTVGTAYLEYTPEWSGGATAKLVADARLIQASTGGVPLFIRGSNSDALMVYDGAFLLGGNSYTAVAGTLGKLASNWSGIVAKTALNGIVNTLAAFDGDLNIGANLYVGSAPTSDNCAFGTLRNVRIYPTALTSAQLVALTAP